MTRISRRVLVACVVACAGGAVSEQEANVNIDKFTFSAARIEVAAGTRVVWTNRDDIPHTVTAVEDPRHMRSPALDSGESYSRVFATPGTYQYFCSLHPRMQGIVVVK